MYHRSHAILLPLILLLIGLMNLKAKVIFLTVFLGLVCFGASNAYALSYPIYFEQFDGSDAPPTGTVTYDATTPSISAAIEWNGHVFDFSDSVLTVTNPGNSIPDECIGSSPQATVLLSMFHCVTPGYELDWG